MKAHYNFKIFMVNASFMKLIYGEILNVPFIASIKFPFIIIKPRHFDPLCKIDPSVIGCKTYEPVDNQFMV